MSDTAYGLIAAAAGLAVSFLNSRLTKSALEGGKSGLLLGLRAVISASFIALLFVLGTLTGIPLEPLLIGGAAGLTVGLAVFTVSLMKGRGR